MLESCPLSIVWHWYRRRHEKKNFWKILIFADFFLFGRIFKAVKRSQGTTSFFPIFMFLFKNIGPKRISDRFSERCFSVAHMNFFQRSWARRPLSNFSYLEQSEPKSPYWNSHYFWKLPTRACFQHLFISKKRQKRHIFIDFLHWSFFEFS